mmetsp:Transcript_63757/g.179479  ORF Transcript_63757/g.179479 Transcript_63757/m.179479 type:complete len:214 (-) Transcript_63757:8-649(-)
MSKSILESTLPPNSMTIQRSLFVSAKSSSFAMCRMPGYNDGEIFGVPPGPKRNSPTRISLLADRTSAECFESLPFATCFTATGAAYLVELASHTAPHAPRPSSHFFVYSGRKRPPYSRSTSSLALDGAAACACGPALRAHTRPTPDCRQGTELRQFWIGARPGDRPMDARALRIVVACVLAPSPPRGGGPMNAIPGAAAASPRADLLPSQACA